MHEIVVSTHIPKTAGTTLRNILFEVYGEDFIWLTQTNSAKSAFEKLYHADWYRIKIIHGHISYGLHKYLPEDITVKYIIFLRHPGERLLSYFNFILQDYVNKEYAWDSKYKWLKDMSFNSWLSSCRIADQDNGITRFLSGYKNLNTNPIINKVNYSSYEIAKRNLSKYAFIGISDKFDYYIKNLAEILNWNNIPEYKREWYFPDRVHFNDLSDDDRLLVETTQKYDFDIWRYINND